MTDLAVRISLFVSGGLICRECGVEIDGRLPGSPRTCEHCRTSIADTAAAPKQTSLAPVATARQATH